MKTTLVIVLVAVCLGVAAIYTFRASTDLSSLPTVEPIAPESDPLGAKHLVLVELFTSEGCSSCPPADRELTFLSTQQPVAGAEVVPLSFHVDYWDGPEWRDAFSSAEYSERQNLYTSSAGRDSNYTPQMIVDGSEAFVGSDAPTANTAIADAGKTVKGVVDVTINGRKADISIANLPNHENSTAFLAVAEDGLTTKVRGGENGGRELSHTSVVRQLSKLGQISAGENSFKTAIDLPTASEWKTANLNYVIFVQENGNKKVIAIGKTKATN